MVDDCDFEFLSTYKWVAVKESRLDPIFYAKGIPWARLYERPAVKRVFMHTLISGFTLTDHADGNGLNNREFARPNFPQQRVAA